MLASVEGYILDQLWSCVLQTLYLRSRCVACLLGSCAAECEVHSHRLGAAVGCRCGMSMWR